MREGRLQTRTLINIWKSLDHQQEEIAVPGSKEFPVKLQKSFIPTQGDSPLYRLVSTSSAENSFAESQADLFTTQPVLGENPAIPDILSFPSASRHQSVPNVYSFELNQHLPPPRIVQSTGNLFANAVEHLGHIRRPVRPARTQSFLQSLSHSDRNSLRGKDWTEEYCHIDIDWSMQAMDVLYSASFYDYIRDEKNVELSAMRLSRIIKDYKPRQVANALTWMTQGWSIENSATLLKVVFSDWLPDLAGKTWPQVPQCSLCTAYILVSEPAQSSALFIRSLTHYWTKKESVDLITYLDSVLKWSIEYLQEVIIVFASTLEDEEASNSNLEKYEQVKCASKLFGAATDLLTAKNDFSNAGYQFILFNHWSDCAACQNKEECDELKHCRRNYESNPEFDGDRTLPGSRATD